MVNKNLGQNNIPCPVCKTNIPFDPILLLKGASFSCPNCHAAVSISNQSMNMAQSAFQEMEKLSTKKK